MGGATHSLSHWACAELLATANEVRPRPSSSDYDYSKQVFNSFLADSIENDTRQNITSLIMFKFSNMDTSKYMKMAVKYLKAVSCDRQFSHTEMGKALYVWGLIV